MATSYGKAAEPFLLGCLTFAFDNCAAKNKAVSGQAEATSSALSKALAPALSLALPAIFASIDQGKNWPTRCAAMGMIADAQKVAPAALARCLPAIIPELTPCMTDTKKEVKKAAKKAMEKGLKVANNKDVEPVVGDLVECIIKPALVPELMHKLGGVVFVQTIDSPTLAVMVPLLVRGLRESQTSVKRTTAVIIDNMSKLVENPIEAAPFLPLLLPALEKSADSVSDPEARAVCDRALQQLTRLNSEILKVGDVGKTDPAVVDAIIRRDLKVGAADGAFAEALGFTSALLGTFIDSSARDAAVYTGAVEAYLGSFVAAPARKAGGPLVANGCIELIKTVPEEEEPEDGKEVLADVEFTLAYGTKILLHNTKLKLKRGSKYGLLGPNDCGKTTLMRSIAEGQIDGFPPPTELRTVFVEADILGELSHLTCTEYVLADPRIQADGITEAQVREALMTNHFVVKMLDDGVSTLSGGWRMKLALSRAMLLKADILLMDEPTNHLDVMNVKWVKEYIKGLSNVTCIMVSHDSGLLDDVCTNIIQIERLKLHMHTGNLSAFVEKHPEAKSYFAISESKQKFVFPQPGPLDGVKSKGKALMKMEGVSYMYPVNKHYTITGITVQVSLSSRVGCVGPNGAGKSTMIKCLTGEVEPTIGTRWAHPSLRMAYVAQHAFHHIESHLSKTPNEYIRWRYQAGDDKEAMNKVTMVLTAEEEALVNTPFEYQWKEEGSEKVNKAMRRIEKLTMMRRNVKGSKEYEYEVKFAGLSNDANVYMSASKLKKQGFEKWVMQVDQKIAARAGMYVRALTQGNVEKHLEDVGLDKEYGTHFRLNALSGGQKVKVVIGAAMWNQPHVVILDEPTNYLDRDSLGALANAIIEYEGGVVIITHNDEFCRTICPERWVLEKMGDGIGRLDCQGDPDWMTNVVDQKIEFKQAEEMVDAAGNVTKVKQEKKELSRKEEKALKKRLQAKIKNKEVLDSDEEEFAIENGLKD